MTTVVLVVVALVVGAASGAVVYRLYAGSVAAELRARLDAANILVANTLGTQSQPSKKV